MTGNVMPGGSTACCTHRVLRLAWLCVLLPIAAGMVFILGYLSLNGVDPQPRRSYHVSYPHPYHFILDEPDCCLGDQTPFLVLMVPVAPGNLVSRQVIRRTWGKEGVVLGRAVRVLFLLGMPGGAGVERQQEELKTESLEHHDLLQSDFLDSYFNLTIKTMVMLEWLSSRCPNASYAMKVDSDMFVNVHNLVSMLAAPDTPTRNYITGQIARFSPVHRDPASKWYLPTEAFPSFIYPPYVMGFCYVFSLDLPGRILEASRHVQAVHIEDVYVGMCLEYIGVLPTNPPASDLFSDKVLAYSHCRYSSLIATMTSGSDLLMGLWEDFQKPGPSCPPSWRHLLIQALHRNWST
ncbi:beta-1,3-galactosyltransferase 2-like isoform X2 [Osmerus eperlanus]|uniref:beta-1,3-galactosyltransferase 2-like isoform X2 n=1 Tax=Osmerus eperlanus TaxID=29151 RepID=UPI002E10D883